MHIQNSKLLYISVIDFHLIRAWREALVFEVRNRQKSIPAMLTKRNKFPPSFVCKHFKAFVENIGAMYSF